MKSIDEVFGDIDEEITEIKLDEVNVQSVDSYVDISEDYSFVREKLIHSIIRGSEIIDASVKEMKILASARAIEAASLSVKSLTDASKALLDLHKNIRDIEKDSGIDNSKQVNGNDENIVLKSTLADLIKSISDENDKQVNG